MTETVTGRGLSPSSSTRSQPSPRRVLLFVLSALVFSAIITWLASTTGRQQFPGFLVSEEVIVQAPVNGVIDVIEVESGQIVLPGRELFVIVDPEAEKQLAAAEADVQKWEQQLRIARLNRDRAAAEIRSRLNREIFETKLKLAEFASEHYQGEFEETAWNDFLNDDRLGRALASTAGSPIDIEFVTKPEINPAESRMEAIVRRAAAINRQETVAAKIQLCDEQLNRLEQQREQLDDSEAATAAEVIGERNLEAAKDLVAVLSEGDPETVVEASSYGIASDLRQAEGDRVRRGAPVLRLTNRRRESIQVEVPARLVAGIDEDTHVQIVFPGHVKREGKVDAVPSRVTKRGTADDPESRIALRILPLGREWPAVPVGSTVYVSFPD